MDRLLSGREIYEVVEEMDGFVYQDVYAAIAKTQLSKVDKEWVEWIEKNCTADVYGGMTFLHKGWQEGKRSIGL